MDTQRLDPGDLLAELHAGTGPVGDASSTTEITKAISGEDQRQLGRLALTTISAAAPTSGNRASTLNQGIVIVVPS